MKDIVLITGSGGLIGSEAAKFFLEQGYQVIGIDNDARKYFFGASASTLPNLVRLSQNTSYEHRNIDIREYGLLYGIFFNYRDRIKLVLHCAAQPSHDWAAKEPQTDFSINAVGTSNVLELARLHCSQAVFVFLSTNKVYGDLPNKLALREESSRWESYCLVPVVTPGGFTPGGFTINNMTTSNLNPGIDESMSLDQSLHSLFGASKVAADILTQEYGRYFGMKTTCLRGGCLTGPQHAGAELHGFLSYLVKCAVEEQPYKIYGYKGKQVRDNIHCKDVVQAIWEIFQAPRCGEVYNIGGGRASNCSVLEAIEKVEQLTGKKMKTEYLDQPRRGDHQWYITNMAKFNQDYPNWKLTYNIDQILEELVNARQGG